VNNKWIGSLGKPITFLSLGRQIRIRMGFKRDHLKKRKALEFPGLTSHRVKDIIPILHPWLEVASFPWV